LLGHALDALERGIAKARFPEGLRTQLNNVRRRKRLADRGADTKGQSAKMLPVVTPIAVEVASDLIPLVDKDTGVVLDATKDMRERIEGTTGVAIPGVRFRGNEGDLSAGTYIFMLDEIPLLLGSVDLRQVLMKVPEETLTANGISSSPAADPLDHAPARWVSSDDAARVEGERLDAAGYLVRHLEGVLRANLAMFVTEQTVGDRLGSDKGDAMEIANDAALLSGFTRVLKALVEEGVPTTALGALCSTFVTNARAGGDIDMALHAARALADVVPEIQAAAAGTLYSLSGEIERQIREGLFPHGDERLLALKPEPTQEILSAVRSTVLSSTSRSDAVVVEDSLIRRYVRKLLELEFPHLTVLARSELDPGDTRPMTPITLD
jgi:type III secretion protein V